MDILGRIAGFVLAIFAMGFLGILALFSAEKSDALFKKWMEWADAE